jgi:hypothetical protein
MSAPGLAHWVPLRQLRSTVALAIGEAGADAAVTTIMAAIEAGAVPVRWAADLRSWRFVEREMGRQLASSSGAQTQGLLRQMGHPAFPAFTFDPVEGIALAAVRGDPTQEERPGPLPVGPVDVAWHMAAALLDKAGQTQRGAE